LLTSDCGYVYKSWEQMIPLYHITNKRRSSLLLNGYGIWPERTIVWPAWRIMKPTWNRWRSSF